MKSNYDKGIAFIMEGDTEYQFYDALLLFFERHHPDCHLTKAADDIGEPYYLLTGSFGTRIIRFNNVGTITQIHNSVSWFNNICLGDSGFPWVVFLCYDTDAYNANISKFYLDDWQIFRDRLSKRRVSKIIDMAANAEIEDLFLLDLHGVSTFMQLEKELTPEDLPKGRKGSSKMKRLFIEFRKQKKTTAFYHKGERARALIDCLNMGAIISAKLLPLQEIEKECFLN